jgi:signal transduction histidine kinase
MFRSDISVTMSRHQAPSNLPFSHDDHDVLQRSRELLDRQDAERVRIARDLHDTLGQFFAVLALELETLKRRAAAGEDIATVIANIATLSEEARRESDQLAWEIRPPQLGSQGLAEAIPHLLEEWSARTGIMFENHISIGDRRFSPDIETTLFRVLQEAVLNVVKHAGAVRTGVMLQMKDGVVSLTVEDDGIGFRLSSESEAFSGDAGAQGLRGVQERLGLVGGTLEVESEPGRGTTILIHVPV